MRRVIHCQTCGGAYETAQPRTLRCSACAVRQNIVVLGERTRTCFFCEKPFYRLRRNQRACVACDPRTLPDGVSQNADLCRICDTARPLVHELVPVCVWCVDTADPHIHSQVLSRIGKGIRLARAGRG